MTAVNWKELLGWSEDQLDELRFSGFSFLREGLYIKAVLFFEALVILDPTSAYDRQTLGALYLQMDEIDKAEKVLVEALELDPHHEPTLLNYVKTLLTNGKEKRAIELAQNLRHSADQTIAGDAMALVLGRA